MIEGGGKLVGEVVVTAQARSKEVAVLWPPLVSLLLVDCNLRMRDLSASARAPASSAAAVAGEGTRGPPLGLGEEVDIKLVLPSFKDERAPRKKGAFWGLVGAAVGLFRC